MAGGGLARTCCGWCWGGSKAELSMSCCG
jgi:hypothetical protein